MRRKPAARASKSRAAPSGAASAKLIAKLRAAVRHLPGLEDGLFDRAPTLDEAGALKVRGKGICWFKRGLGGALVIRCTLEEKTLLMEAAPEIYFETDHYKGYPAVLIRLAKIGAKELKHRVEIAWRLQAPPRLIKELDMEVANATSAHARAKTKRGTKAIKSVTPRKDKKPVLLSGGNPQIAKGEGNAPVAAYIAAIPGWKRALGRRLDALIARAVPGVRKSVKWNSPLYGAPGQDGWFLSFHCFTNYVKVTFFHGTSLHPVPPGASKHKEVRYLDIRKGELDEAQLTAWVKQASVLPGERM